MSKYEPLENFLRSSGQESVRMSFSELEQILGFPLPESAYHYNAWWENDGHTHPQARAWMNAGYKTELANPKEQTVCFYIAVSN